MDKNIILKAGIAAASFAALSLPGAVYGIKSIPRKEKKKNKGSGTIICIGDSTTFGAGVVMRRKTEAWPYILSRLLKPEYEVLNYGINGAAMVRSGDTPYREDFYKAADEIDPDMILVMLGTNDSKPQNWNAEDFEKDYEAFLQRFMKEGRQIILLVPLKAFAKKGSEISVYDIRDREIREEAIPIIKKLAEKYSLQTIDLYTLTENHPEYFGDGVHPNRLGNQIIANEVYAALRKNTD